MIAESIAFLIRNLPMVLLALALLLGAAGLPRHLDAASRYLAWVLLLPMGINGLWAGIAHMFFPHVAAAHIGWEVSPFQYEVGMADLAVGSRARPAFRPTWEFRAGNFAPGNAGAPFYLDIIAPLLAMTLLFVTRRQRVPLERVPA
jgi:hypothetical protein